LRYRAVFVQLCYLLYLFIVWEKGIGYAIGTGICET